MPDALADPANREEQDRCGDRYEDVVEAGQEPELLFVRDRAVALLLHMRAQRVRVLGADHACGNGVVKLLLAVHAAFLLFRSRIDRVYYSVNTPRQLTLASRIHMAVTDTRRIA